MTSKTAFVIDDEIFIALDVEAHISSLGYDVIGPAYTMKEGFQLIADNHSPPTIALMDINIGGELVWPLAKELKSLGTKIVFISANNQHAELKLSFADSPVIDKPASEENIAAAVASILSR